MSSRKDTLIKLFLLIICIILYTLYSNVCNRMYDTLRASSLGYWSIHGENNLYVVIGDGTIAINQFNADKTHTTLFNAVIEEPKIRFLYNEERSSMLTITIKSIISDSKTPITSMFSRKKYNLEFYPVPSIINVLGDDGIAISQLVKDNALSNAYHSEVYKDVL